MLRSQRCQEAEAKIDLIAEWINAVTNNNNPTSDTTASADVDHLPVPTLVVDDFSPSMGSSSNGKMPNSTITLSSGISQMDLAKLSKQMGTLTMGRKGMGMGLGINMGKMLREESSFDLARAAADDVF
jgi:hypothetical protein